jgi:hypothetical protein
MDKTKNSSKSRRSASRGSKTVLPEDFVGRYVYLAYPVAQASPGTARHVRLVKLELIKAGLHVVDPADWKIPEDQPHRAVRNNMLAVSNAAAMCVVYTGASTGLGGEYVTAHYHKIRVWTYVAGGRPSLSVWAQTLTDRGVWSDYRSMVRHLANTISRW